MKQFTTIKFDKCIKLNKYFFGKYLMVQLNKDIYYNKKI